MSLTTTSVTYGDHQGACDTYHMMHIITFVLIV